MPEQVRPLMRFVLTVFLFLLTWGLTILVALLFGERGAVGLVFTFSFTAIAGWTLAPALEAIWDHFRRDAADDRNPASLTFGSASGRRSHRVISPRCGSRGSPLWA